VRKVLGWIIVLVFLFLISSARQNCGDSRDMETYEGHPDIESWGKIK
jgi:hypothetical protein